MNIILNKINSQKGIAFTVDTIFSVLIILIILFSFSIFTFQKVTTENFFEKQFILEQKTIAISDAIVKNNNSNSFLGMSVIDVDKKRVLSNIISLENKNFNNLNLDNFFIKEITVKFKNNSSQNIFFVETTATSCFSINRFVIVKGITQEKAKIEVVGCYE
jgi:hypothetical protein